MSNEGQIGSNDGMAENIDAEDIADKVNAEAKAAGDRAHQGAKSMAEQAREGAKTAGDCAREGAEKAREHAKAAAEQAREKAKEFAGQSKEFASRTGERAREVADDAKLRAGDAFERFGQIIADTAGVIDENLGAKYGDYARNASEKANRAAEQIREKDMGELGDDAREFVRKNPAVAVGAAVVAGFLASKLFRSRKD